MVQRGVRLHRPADWRKSTWILGGIVEVFVQNLWRPGKIMKVLKNDYFVIRLTCFIQLKEFHISCLRSPQANHGKQSTVIDKDCQGFEKDRHRNKAITTRVVKKLKARRTLPDDFLRVTGKKTEATAYEVHQARKKKLKSRRTLPDDFLRVTGKKTEATADEVHQARKKVLPLKVPDRKDIDGDCLYGPFSNTHNDLDKNSFTRTELECEVLCSSQILLHAREENECSVASCSANCLDNSNNGDQQSIDPRSCFPDDAMSACPARSWWEDNNVYGPSLDMNLHDLELHAYQSTVSAFYASGPLTWEQESLLTNMRLSLNISNEDHLLHLRRLLSS